MKIQYDAQWAVAQLQTKAQQLGKIPTKADFSDADRARIKQNLGPWPRALEMAGVKTKKEKEK